MLISSRRHKAVIIQFKWPKCVKPKTQANELVGNNTSPGGNSWYYQAVTLRSNLNHILLGIYKITIQIRM